MMKIDTTVNYENLKESGEAWLGKIPSTWELIPAKRIFRETSVKNKSEETLLSATQDKGVIPRDLLEDRVMMPMGELNGFKLVEEKDFVISLRSFQGGIEYSNYRGIVSPAYTVLKSICPINEKYFSYLLKSHHFVLELNKAITGIRDGKNISFKEFRKIILPFPPPPAQVAIVKYLDEKFADIDKYISTKQKLIEQLNEQISGFVLCGFNNKSLNWSNDWSDGIPNYWSKQKAKRIFSEIKILNKPEEQLLAVTQDKGVLPKDLCESNFVSPAGSLIGLKLVEENDFVISLRSFQGGIEHSKYRGIVSPAYNVIRLNENSNSHLINYYKYLFKTKRFIQLLNTIISGIRDGKNINFSHFANLILPVPRKEDILKMQHYFARFELMKEKFEQEKKLLKDFSSSLISEAVTGKIKLVANIYEIRTPKNPYFARTVLAAEIINELYKEATFGRVKLVKLLFLSEKLSKLELATNYHRQAAGPYDNKAIRSIEKQLTEHRWFETIKRDKGKGYKPLEKKNEYHLWFDKYYHNEKHIIYSIINTFRTAKSIQCEIVATLYSAWEDLLKENLNVIEDEIINEVLNNWHESKRRIPKDRWLKAINWMKNKNITPLKNLIEK